ncbi:YwiC-like family protein [Paenibacillus glacialis]|uniref:YwiC-like protein n=1 Tax=Paenibacillus glacialis TaxID=494026 RepID=A0A168N269_9BACL|nr:YwiC-like family protein [Paenibacillus glacialis]OAB45306.1 hypothetical protein PGLA_03365 [Paenibacillus glacialis]
MKQQGMVIPHEHGGWAMVIVPFTMGMMTGNPQWMHLFLFLAWFFLYMSSYSFLQMMKKNANRHRFMKWGSIYSSIAILSLIPPLVSYPPIFFFGPLLLVFVSVNIWHVKHKIERALINNLCAIIIFSLGGAAAYLLGGGGWDRTMAMIVIYNVIYFMGTVFFVKSVFRERKNKRWIVYAQIYHVLSVLIPMVLGNPWMMIGYVFPLVRSFALAGKQIKPTKVGIIEIVGAIQFLLLAVILNI